jgi:hypothetical protein
VAAWLALRSPDGGLVLLVDAADQVDRPTALSDVLPAKGQPKVGSTSKILLAGRPSATRRFPPHQIVTIRTFDRRRSERLIDRYFELDPSVGDQRDRLADDAKRGLAAAPDLAATPLLTTLYCWTMVHDPIDGPITRTILYQQVLSYLFLGDAAARDHAWSEVIPRVVARAVQRAEYRETQQTIQGRGPHQPVQLTPPPPRIGIAERDLRKLLDQSLQEEEHRDQQLVEQALSKHGQTVLEELLDQLAKRRILVPVSRGSARSGPTYEALHPSILEFLVAKGQADAIHSKDRNPKHCQEAIDWIDDTCDLEDWEIVHIFTMGLLIDYDLEEDTKLATGLLALIYANAPELIPPWAMPTRAHDEAS